MFCFPDLICVAGLGGLVENITTLLKNLGEAESIKASNDANRRIGNESIGRHGIDVETHAAQLINTYNKHAAN